MRVPAGRGQKACQRFSYGSLAAVIGADEDSERPKTNPALADATKVCDIQLRDQHCRDFIE